MLKILCSEFINFFITQFSAIGEIKISSVKIYDSFFFDVGIKILAHRKLVV